MGMRRYVQGHGYVSVVAGPSSRQPSPATVRLATPPPGPTEDAVPAWLATHRRMFPGQYQAQPGPALCTRCHQTIAPTDDTDADGTRHAACACQQIDEDLLGVGIDVLIVSVQETAREYTDTRRPQLESPEARERVAVLREAVRLLRGALEEATKGEGS